MKKRIPELLTATLLLTFVLFSACKKTEQEANPSSGVAGECNEVQNQWDDILKITQDALVSNSEARTDATATDINCASISAGSGSGIFIGELIVDFGSTPTTCSDGKKRSGQILIYYSGAYAASGTVIQMIAQNYFVDDKQIVGCRTIKNTNGTVFNIVDSGAADSSGYAKVIYSDATFTSWKSSRTRTWTLGYNTPYSIIDDVYSVTGPATGLSRSNASYTFQANSVIQRLECLITYYVFIPSGGDISVTFTDSTRSSIDYGNGTSCDKNVTFTNTDGKQYELSF